MNWTTIKSIAASVLSALWSVLSALIDWLAAVVEKLFGLGVAKLNSEVNPTTPVVESFDSLRQLSNIFVSSFPDPALPQILAQLVVSATAASKGAPEFRASFLIDVVQYVDQAAAAAGISLSDVVKVELPNAGVIDNFAALRAATLGSTTGVPAQTYLDELKAAATSALSSHADQTAMVAALAHALVQADKAAAVSNIDLDALLAR